MKNNFFVCIFLSFIIACGAVSTIRAQDKPQAIKFAEYNNETESLQKLAETAESFAARLRDESATTKGFIAYFRGISYLSRYERKYSEVFVYLKDFATRNKNLINEKGWFAMGWTLIKSH